MDAAPTDAEFRLIFERSPHPYLLLLPDARFTMVAANRQYLAIVGRKPADLLGHGLFEAFPDNPAQTEPSAVAELRASLRRVADQGVQEVQGVHRHDIQMPGSADYAERYWSLVNSPIFDEAGEVRFILHHVRDVTEFVLVRDASRLHHGAQRDLSRMQAEVLLRANQVKEANDKLRGALELAEAANRELDAFSYSVAHDLRAPLRSIDGFSQALLEDYRGSLDQDGRQYLNYVRDAAQQMGRLIDDLLGLARVSRSELRRGPVDLSALAADIAGRLSRAQPQRQVEWVIGPGLQAHADNHLLQIAMENLLGNAWKFTGKRTHGRIEVGVQRAAGSAPAFFVADNGAGFDPAYSAKLFGVFQRLHSVQEFDGTGIGLATVQRIVRRHNGRVWAEGAVDAGARFYFTLGGDSAARETEIQ